MSAYSALKAGIQEPVLKSRPQLDDCAGTLEGPKANIRNRSDPGTGPVVHPIRTVPSTIGKLSWTRNSAGGMPDFSSDPRRNSIVRP